MSEVYKIQVNDSEPIEVSQQVYEVSSCFNEMLKEKDKEIERLNNIINELDNWLGKKILSWEDDGKVSDTIYHERLAIQMIYFKLQELKGSE